MKKCPFCAEEIQDDAVKCRYCGEMMSEKPQKEPVIGFWEYLGQKAKKSLYKFEFAIKSNKKQRQADAERIKHPKASDYVVGCLGCLTFLIIIIVIIIFYLGSKATLFEFITNLVQ